MMTNNSLNINGQFVNLAYSRLRFRESKSMKEVFKKRCENKHERIPQNPLLTQIFDKNEFAKREEAFAWFGHSTLLLRLAGKTIVCDPVFGRASPFSFIGPKPFPNRHRLTYKDLPSKIDVLLLTHDHYDHLEKKTIKKIEKNVEKFLVPLKVKETLVKWGVKKGKITEFDWHSKKKIEDLIFTLTPSRHFSGRGLRDRNATLWGGWVIKSTAKKIYISGDGGYSDQFKAIGEAYGPFDIAFLECGQYNFAWYDVHMMPQESVQAGIDVKSKVIMPIHWGKYDLSDHSWKEPVQQFVQEAKHKKQRVATPLIGEIFDLNKLPTYDWWN